MSRSHQASLGSRFLVVATGNEELIGQLPMRVSIALKDLFADRIKLIATLIGITFSVILMAGQTAIFLGACRDITIMIDRSRADLWIMPQGASSFEDAFPVLTEFERQSALVTPGVKRVTSLVTCFSNWQQPSGEANIIVLVGSERGSAGPQPFVSDAIHDEGGSSVVIDNSYLGALGVSGIGASAGVNDYSVRVSALSKGIRSFTHSPYVFVSPSEARKYLDLPFGQSTFLLVDVDDLTHLEYVRAKLRERMPNVDILTTGEFRTRSIDRWLYQTGAGQALVLGTILGAIIGAAIIAQNINMSVEDHLYEFALLRAMGASRGYLQLIVLIQVLVMTSIGTIAGIMIILFLVPLSEKSPLLLMVSASQLTLVVFSTFVIGLLSSTVAIRKVRNVDPVTLLK